MLKINQTKGEVCVFERSLIFNENPKPEYLWCCHCNRVYKYGEFRLVNDLQMCPYSGCNGDTVMDACDWSELQKFYGYPEIPEKGVVYPGW